MKNEAMERLTGSETAERLIKMPELADTLDLRRMSGYDWMEVLSKQPQLADKCDWRKMQLVPMGFWYNFLVAQPQFQDKCDLKKVDVWADDRILIRFPEIARKYDWSMLSGKMEVALLLKYPEMEGKCDWDRLARCDWVKLLAKNEKYRKYCEEEILESIDNDELDSSPQGWQMVTEVQNDPDVAETYDWSKLNCEEWECLWRDSPEIAEEYEEEQRDWTTMTGREWVAFLKDRPEDSWLCDWWKVRGLDLAKLLAVALDFIDDCDLSLMNGEGWAYLLARRPELAMKCNDWWMLCEEDWEGLLKEQPQFADKARENGYDITPRGKNDSEKGSEDDESDNEYAWAGEKLFSVTDLM